MTTKRIDARPPAIDAAIGRRVELRLDAVGMTQAELAVRLGLSQATVSRKLHGLRPWFASELVTVADALGMTITDLFSQRRQPVLRLPALAATG